MQKTLVIDADLAKELYPKADESFKQRLETTFGKPHFTSNIMDRINTFDDILSIGGKTMDDMIGTGLAPDEIAYRQGKLIALVYNEGEMLDPNNLKQDKHFPWFEITPGSGFGLSFYAYDRWLTYSHVGLRLCFKRREHAIDAGKKFPEVYANFLIK